MHSTFPDIRRKRSRRLSLAGASLLAALALSACGQNSAPMSAGDQSWTAPAEPGAGTLALTPGDNLLTFEKWTSASNGFGPIEINKSNGGSGANDGRTLSIGGKTYASGFGTHASSSMTFNVGGGKCDTFTADVGVDDEVGSRGSVVFQVFADNQKLFDSGVMRGSDAARTLKLNVAGKQELKLVVTDGGDGNGSDHADWANPKLLACASMTSPPPGATRTVTLGVPASMRSAPFDVPRTLRVPPNFSVSVYARIDRARFLLPLPGGDVLVSQPSSGKIRLVRPNLAGEGVVSDFATGLKSPHDLVLDIQNGTTYLYVAESNRVTRSIYQRGDTSRRAAQTVVANLPDASLPELHGAYAHALKNIAIDGNHKLYVSVASATNADPADLAGSPKRAAIYQYNADGTGGRLFAQGIRNAEGLAFVPGTGELWAAVNNRDNIAYPFHNDWLGDGTGDDYGKVMQSYVDNHPPEEFTRVRDGGNYGWPFCNPNPDAGVNDMPFDRDVQNNPNGSKLNCASIDRISKGIQAHSAPLGLSFLQGSNFAAVYRGGAVIALHGCWNCSKFIGHKVVYFPWSASGTPGDEIDLVAGWVTDAASKLRWGRPVDAVPDAAGNLLISDDLAGAVYKLSPAK